MQSNKTSERKRHILPVSFYILNFCKNIPLIFPITSTAGTGMLWAMKLVKKI